MFAAIWLFYSTKLTAKLAVKISTFQESNFHQDVIVIQNRFTAAKRRVTTASSYIAMHHIGFRHVLMIWNSDLKRSSPSQD